jgi:type IV pilus assembly PilX-like protein
MKTWRPITDERGIAFPTAMLVMVILTAIMAAFAVLSTSEPQIAGNHMASIQARALAESGLERALWALTQGEASPAPSGALVNSGPPNYTIAVVPPYDGATFVSVSSLGGFKVTVADGAQINQKVVTAVGYVPNDTNPIAVKKITAVATRVKWIDPYCGVCAGGESPPGATATVRVGGNARVNATTSAHGSGGHHVPAGAMCSGVTPIAAVATTNNGSVNLNGTPDLYAPPNLEGPAATQANATFPPTMTLTDADMAALKALAKAKGTYYKPSSPGGTITWTSPPPDGIIYVDTYSGNPLTSSSPSSDLITVDIHGNWGGAGWSGWLVVAGSISISGHVTMNGLIYAQNDVSLNGTGGGGITGAVISTNRKDSTASTIADSEDIGNAPIAYSCPAVRSGGGQISQNWFVAPGTYQEIAGR